MNLTSEEKQQLEELIYADRKFDAIRLLVETQQMKLIDAKEFVDELSKSVRKNQPEAYRNSKLKRKNTNSFGANKLLWIFYAIGLLLIGLATFIHYQNEAFKKNAILAEATVVDYEKISSQGSSTFACVFAYELEGQDYQFTSATSSSSPSLKIGEKVGIFINPENPYDTLVDNFWEQSLFAVILGGIGFIFIGIAFFVGRFMS